MDSKEETFAPLKNFTVNEHLQLGELGLFAGTGYFGDNDDKLCILTVRPNYPKTRETWDEVVKNMGANYDIYDEKNDNAGTGFNYFKGSVVHETRYSCRLVNVWEMQGSMEQKQKTFSKYYKKFKIQDLRVMEETPEIYQNVTKKYIESIPETHSKWVCFVFGYLHDIYFQLKSENKCTINVIKCVPQIDEILQGKKEQHRVVLDVSTHDDKSFGFITVFDTKWSCKPEKFNKAEWKNTLPNIEQSFYLLCLVRDKRIKSIRDLNGTHLELLEMIYYVNLAHIQSLFGLKKDQLRIFVHYYPQYYHLHIHFCSVKINFGIESGRAILLKDIIQNIKMKSDYYQKCTLTAVLGKERQLYKDIIKSGLFV